MGEKKNYILFCRVIDGGNNFDLTILTSTDRDWRFCKAVS